MTKRHKRWGERVAGKTVRWFSHHGRDFGSSSKESPYDPATPHLGTVTREVRIGIHQKLVRNVHSSTSHNRPKAEKTKYPPMDEWTVQRGPSI